VLPAVTTLCGDWYPRYARLSEALIQKYEHHWREVFVFLDQRLARWPAAGRPPAPRWC